MTKINSTGSALLLSTTLGGSNSDAALRVALEATGNLWVVGFTSSEDFPVKGRDYISALAIDAAGSVLVSGVTSSPDLQMLNPFQAALAATPDQQGSQCGQDAFLAKLTWEADPVRRRTPAPIRLLRRTSRAAAR